MESRWFRLIMGIFVPLLFFLGSWYLYRFGNPFVCPFHELTHLYCPGCGSGRAAASLLRFDFVSALDYNALFVLVLPFLAYYLIRAYVIIVFMGSRIPIFGQIPIWGYKVVAILIISYWILRNIPVFPFTVIAP